jgi:predicted metalloendopeptidase
MPPNSIRAALAVSSVLALACHAPHDEARPQRAPAGALWDGLDDAVAPGDDFFAWVNGAWSRATEIPADRSDAGVGQDLIEEANRRTAELIRDAEATRPPAGSEARKIADYYAAFLDEAAIERAGLAPLAPTLARIAAIADRTDLASYLGSTLQADVDALNYTNFQTDAVFGLWIAQDLADPTQYSAFLLQGGLGLPDREYYLAETPEMERLRAAYRAHAAEMFRLAGAPLSDARLDALLALERRIAESHATREESEDAKRGLNRWSRSELAQRAPGLDWDAYFAAAQLAGVQRFVIWHPSAATGISALTAHAPLEAWRDELTLRALDHWAPYLPAAFVSERFSFYGRTLTGTPQLRPRWKRGVAATNEALGDAVGKLYVRRWFPPEEKRRADAMVRNLIAAFGARVDRLEWMTPATKARAREKLATLRIGVGYPDGWRDYAALEVRRDDALGNAMRAERFESAWQRAKLGRPVDRGEWVLTPQTVNAVNLPALNAMNFPAAILQPPYFDPSQPLAADYGAIGATIGHEISHSFDDQGALFDASGRLANWWTPDDFAHFSAAGERLAAQYSAYRPFPDLPLNGKLVLSENIADLAGLAVAFDAFERSAERASAPTLGRFTPEQQFFLAFARSWREKVREPALRQQILTDGHAPSAYRVLTVRNLDAWYDAFGAKPGDALYLAPGERVRVW